MTGQNIPMVTWYKHTDRGLMTFKKPKYVLQSTAEVKAKQDKLGKNVGWYFGTWCKKCCEVYPAFYTEDGFEASGYYVCLVCGKESKHEPMPWMAKDDWNNDVYAYVPEENNYQYSIFDFIS